MAINNHSFNLLYGDFSSSEDCDTAISIAVVKNLARYMDRVSQANR